MQRGSTQGSRLGPKGVEDLDGEKFLRKIVGKPYRYESWRASLNQDRFVSNDDFEGTGACGIASSLLMRIDVALERRRSMYRKLARGVGAVDSVRTGDVPCQNSLATRVVCLG